MCLNIYLNHALIRKLSETIAIQEQEASLADEPVIWWATDLHTALLTVDVTAIYLTNASGAEATVKIRVLEDTTP